MYAASNTKGLIHDKPVPIITNSNSDTVNYTVGFHWNFGRILKLAGGNKFKEK
jgi:hypothetical protein